MNTTFDLVSRLQEPDGGFTVHPYSLEDVVGGYAVSIYPGATRCSDTISESDIQWYVTKHGQYFIEHGTYLGGWHNPEDGKVYLDISVVVDTADEAETLAREHKQLAYYDFAANKSVPVEAEAPVAAEFKPFDMLSFVIAWREGNVDMDEEIEGFQQMINTGIVWELEGMYGRRAAQLIDAGDCTLPA